jgi:hypothetical protein
MCCVAPFEPPNGCERVSDIFIQKYINLKVGGVRNMFVEYGEQTATKRPKIARFQAPYLRSEIGIREY